MLLTGACELSPHYPTGAPLCRTLIHHTHCTNRPPHKLQELTPVVKGFAPVPSTALFDDFCRTKVVGGLPAAQRAPRRDTVVRIEPLEGAGGCGRHAGLLPGRACPCIS